MKNFYIVILLLSMPLLGSCDVFRALAGRPVSSEIEAKRAEILAREDSLHKARIDSLNQVSRQMADSLAVLDSLKAMNGKVLNTSAIGVVDAGALESAYYIVVGAFMDKGNADYMADNAEKYGYKAAQIKFRNGFNAVAVCPADNIVEAYAALKSVSQEKFCPKDAWILVNQ